jgi:hypothetical protein
MTIYKINMRLPTIQIAWLFVFSFALVALSLQPNKVRAESEDWQQWAVNNPASTEEIDHSIWNRILKTYVSTNSKGQNLFNYAAVSPADQRALKHYLEVLSLVKVGGLNKNEQLAFWINAYNAIVVQAILKSYPVESVLDVDGNIFNRGPWKDNYFSVGGMPINLFNIRHNILFANWDDIRVIYTLSCGAIGCPNIGSKAVRGKHVGGYLNSATIAFINGPVAILKFDNGSIKTSRLFYWSKREFKKRKISLLSHLKFYAAGDMAYKLKSVDRFAGYGFNWHLNDLPSQ